VIHCPRCGSEEHEQCERGGPLDPPRFCTRCGRRLEVQVLPDGYTARCRACDAAAAS
jgi:DNA-directed RNA polymerase subunit RPC12/RpoP